MRILFITAGAAGMYCGSCFRDNALARELMARGHAVTLLPLYTPTRTDEENVSRADVLFGGISVYLQQKSGIFRHTPRFLDRLWDSPRVIGAFAGRGVSSDARTLGDLTISMLEGEHGILRKEFEKLIDWTRGEPVPDVINLPNSLLIALGPPLKRVLERPLFVTLQGEELFINGLPPVCRDAALERIRALVPQVDGFIAVSDYCARFMADLLHIPADRVRVVPLGIDLAGYEPGPRSASPYRVGYFARVAPEKGLHVLAEAYVRFRRRAGGADARLEAAGYLARNHEAYLRQASSVLARAGLAEEFVYHGSVDRAGKLAFLRSLDVLSVPATYDEPKGMFLLEGMAAGVPLVQPRRGAFVEILDRTGGGVLVDPDDPDALADGLYRVWSDRAFADTLSRRGLEGVRAHYTVGASAARLMDVYATAASPGSRTRVPAPG